MSKNTLEITLKTNEKSTTITGDTKSIQEGLLFEAVTLGLKLNDDKTKIIEEMLYNSELYKYFENFIKIAKKIEKEEIIWTST